MKGQGNAEMNHTTYRLDYDPDNPDNVTAVHVPQAESSSEKVLNEIEKEIARQRAKDAEEYAAQVRMETERTVIEADRNIEQGVQAGRTEEASNSEKNEKVAESGGRGESFCTMEPEEKAEYVPTVPDILPSFEQEPSGSLPDGLETSDSSQSAHRLSSDISLEKIENFLSGCTEDLDELKSIFLGYKEDIEKMNRSMMRLEKKFDSEILNAQNRDSAVKAIYKEMNEYKSGLVEKAMKNVLYDIVDFREMMLSQLRAWRGKKDVENISLEDFESYADDLADILERYDVTIYKGESGQENTAVRQKIVRKVETEDEALVKKVADSLSYGYEYNEKVLYPEKISIYVKKK